ncbi:hypothetical protein H7H82_20850 [Mycobacterium heidelbergense]|uniref:hypothetical protein n=1 Tax=Mycobacterium heidelbergense TaxID=53376 RepID=UPI001151152A|nr:hypothetical protein [Mycobacterium heidelbergense]MCV7053007.1 hypothetical protein [Mycobacterium heidelbergense]
MCDPAPERRPAFMHASEFVHEMSNIPAAGKEIISAELEPDYLGAPAEVCAIRIGGRTGPPARRGGTDHPRDVVKPRHVADARLIQLRKGKVRRRHNKGIILGRRPFLAFP